jgi:hypothetical protein
VIHYHGLPMWPEVAMVQSFAARHGMCSFAHPRQIEIAAEVCQSVVLDNGAFSAWKGKQKYDFAGYTAWAAKWLKHPAVEWCVIPDIIDGSEEDNDALVEHWEPDLVQRSVPVFHMHESLKRLDNLCRWPRVALGSSGEFAKLRTPSWWARMAEMMAVLCDKDGMPRTKLHGLRMLDPDVFSHLPLASADSCNVARNVGLDGRWVGPYIPRSKHVKALVMMDRIEAHASARRWSFSGGDQRNFELIG